MHCSLTTLSALALILATQCVLSAPSWKPSANFGPGRPAADQPSALGSGYSPPRANDGSGDVVQQPSSFVRSNKPQSPPKDDTRLVLGRNRSPGQKESDSGRPAHAANPPQPPVVVDGQPKEDDSDLKGKPAGFLQFFEPEEREKKRGNTVEVNKARSASPKPASADSLLQGGKSSLNRFNVAQAEPGKPYGFLGLIDSSDSEKPNSADALLKTNVNIGSSQSQHKPRSTDTLLNRNDKRARGRFNRLLPDFTGANAGQQPSQKMERKNEPQDNSNQQVEEEFAQSGFDHGELADVGRITAFVNFLDLNTMRSAPKDLFNPNAIIGRVGLDYAYVGAKDATLELDSAYNDKFATTEYKNNLLLDVAATIRRAMVKTYRIPEAVEKQLFQVLFGTETPSGDRTILLGQGESEDKVKDIFRTKYQDTILRDLHKKLLIHLFNLTNRGLKTATLAERVASLLFASVDANLYGPRVEATKWLITNAPLIFDLFD